MTRQVFDNSMTAHVWAQGVQDSGRSSNGNFYFSGRTLYSYGSHYVVGFLLAPGRALINGDGYSVSTSRHKGYAERALNYRGLVVPDLTGLAKTLDRYGFGRLALTDAAARNMPRYNAEEAPAARKAVADWVAGEAFPGPWHETADSREARATRAATTAEADLIRSRPLIKRAPYDRATDRLARSGAPDFPTIDPRAVAAVLVFLGLTDAAADKEAARMIKARERNAAAWAEAAARFKDESTLAAGRALADKPLSELAAELKAETRGRYFSAAQHGGQWLDKARDLFRARKIAKAKGWPKVAAEMKARESLIRAEVKTWEGQQAAIYARRDARQGLELIRSGLAMARRPFAELARLESDSSVYYGEKPAFVIASAVKAAECLALCHDPDGRAYAPGRVPVARALRATGLDAEGCKAARNAAAGAGRGLLARLKTAAARELQRKDLAAIRAFRAAVAGGQPVPLAVATAAHGAALYRLNPPAVTSDQFRGRDPFKVGGWTLDNWRDLSRAATAEMQAAKARAEAEKEAALRAWESSCRAAWIAGEPTPARPAGIGYYSAGAFLNRLSDPEGGALIRAEDVTRDESGQIVGGILRTSWGATVPLAHAVRAFRFLALVRAKAEADESFDGWRANGRTLPVGHFRIESVSRDGSFKAGCHRINWQEVARVSQALGLSARDLAADTTEKTPGH